MMRRSLRLFSLQPLNGLVQNILNPKLNCASRISKNGMTTSKLKSKSNKTELLVLSARHRALPTPTCIWAVEDLITASESARNKLVLVSYLPTASLSQNCWDTLCVFLPSQCWCRRSVELTAILKQHWEDEETSPEVKKKKKTALSRSVLTIFVWDCSFDRYTGYLYLLIGVLSST